MNKIDSQQKPLIGFLPAPGNLAETGRAVVIAKRLKELGCNILFFSHGGRYEFLIKDNDFRILRVKPCVTDEQMKEALDIFAMRTLRSKTLIKEDTILEFVEEEISAFKRTGIKLLVSTNCPSGAISTRAANIPYINIVPSPGFFSIKIYDEFENIFTFLIPQFIKIKILMYFMSKTKWYLKPINKVAEKVGAPKFKHTFDIFRGDFLFRTNYLEFINVFPNKQQVPAEEYIGIILLDELFIDKIPKVEAEKIDADIEAHIKRPGKSILVTLGSSGTKEFFTKVLKTLNKTDYNVIAVYTSVLDEKNLPELDDNILLKKFVPSISKINRMVDLAIIHGGQGTVFTAAYSKKPVIGFPMSMEQHINLEKLVGHGSGIMLSKKYFTEEKLLSAIDEISNNYNKHLVNAEKLANKIPPPKGAENAAKRILEIIQEKT